MSSKSDVSASVTVPRTSDTSVVTRDTICPARCRLKKARSSRWMWVVSWARRALENAARRRRDPLPRRTALEKLRHHLVARDDVGHPDVANAADEEARDERRQR